MWGEKKGFDVCRKMKQKTILFWIWVERGKMRNRRVGEGALRVLFPCFKVGETCACLKG